MDNTPFISRNNDLIIMLIAGIAIHFTNHYVVPLSVQTQFLIILMFAFFSGLFLNALYQSVEWAIFFAIGIQVVAVTPFAVGYLTDGQIFLPNLIATITETGRYSVFLLSSWLVGIPLGYSIKKLVMDNYYRHRLF